MSTSSGGPKKARATKKKAAEVPASAEKEHGKNGDGSKAASTPKLMVDEGEKAEEALTTKELEVVGRKRVAPSSPRLDSEEERRKEIGFQQSHDVSTGVTKISTASKKRYTALETRQKEVVRENFVDYSHFSYVFKFADQIGTGSARAYVDLGFNHRPITDEETRLTVNAITQRLINRHFEYGIKLGSLVIHSSEGNSFKNINYLKAITSLRFCATPVLELVAYNTVFLDECCVSLKRYIDVKSNIQKVFEGHSPLRYFDPRRSCLFHAYRAIYYKAGLLLNSRFNDTVISMGQNGFALSNEQNRKAVVAELGSSKKDPFLVYDFNKWKSTFQRFDLDFTSFTYLKGKSDLQVRARFETDVETLKALQHSNINMSYLIHLSACFGYDGQMIHQPSRSALLDQAVLVYKNTLQSLSVRTDGIDNIVPRTRNSNDIDTPGLFAMLFPIFQVDEFYLYVFFARMYTAHSTNPTFSGSKRILNTFLHDFTHYHHTDVDAGYFLRMVGFVSGMATWNIPGMALPESSIFVDMLKPRLDEVYDQDGNLRDAIAVVDHEDHPFSTYMNGTNIELGFGTLISPLRVFLTFTFLPYTRDGTRIMNSASVVNINKEGGKILTGLSIDDLQNRLLFGFLPVYLLMIHDFTVAVFSWVVREGGSLLPTVDDLFDALSSIMVSFSAFIKKEKTPTLNLMPIQTAIGILQGLPSFTSLSAFCALTAMQVLENVKVLLFATSSGMSLFNISASDNEELASRLYAMAVSLFSKREIDLGAETVAIKRRMHSFSTIVNSGADSSPISSADFSEVIDELSSRQVDFREYMQKSEGNQTFLDNLRDSVFATFRLQALVDPLQVINYSIANLNTPFKFYVPLLTLSSIREWRGMNDALTSGTELKTTRAATLLRHCKVKGGLEKAINSFLQKSCGTTINGAIKVADVMFIMIAMGFFRRLKITMTDESSEGKTQKQVIDYITGKSGFTHDSPAFNESFGKAFELAKKVAFGFEGEFNFDKSLFVHVDKLMEDSRQMAKGLGSSLDNPLPDTFSLGGGRVQSASSSSRVGTPVSDQPPATLDFLSRLVQRHLSSIIENSTMASINPFNEGTSVDTNVSKKIVKTAAAEALAMDPASQAPIAALTTSGSDSIASILGSVSGAVDAIPILESSATLGAASMELTKEEDVPSLDDSASKIADAFETVAGSLSSIVMPESQSLSEIGELSQQLSSAIARFSSSTGSAHLDSGLGETSSSSSSDQQPTAREMAATIGQAASALAQTQALETSVKEGIRDTVDVINQIVLFLPVSNEVLDIDFDPSGDRESLLEILEQIHQVMVSQRFFNESDFIQSAEEFFVNNDTRNTFPAIQQLARSVYKSCISLLTIARSDAGVVDEEELGNLILPAFVERLSKQVTTIRDFFTQATAEVEEARQKVLVTEDTISELRYELEEARKRGSHSGSNVELDTLKQANVQITAELRVAQKNLSSVITSLKTRGAKAATNPGFSRVKSIAPEGFESVDDIINFVDDLITSNERLSGERKSSEIVSSANTKAISGTISGLNDIRANLGLTQYRLNITFRDSDDVSRSIKHAESLVAGITDAIKKLSQFKEILQTLVQRVLKDMPDFTKKVESATGIKFSYTIPLVMQSQNSVFLGAVITGILDSFVELGNFAVDKLAERIGRESLETNEIIRNQPTMFDDGDGQRRRGAPDFSGLSFTGGSRSMFDQFVKALQDSVSRLDSNQFKRLREDSSPLNQKAIETLELLVVTNAVMQNPYIQTALAEHSRFGKVEAIQRYLATDTGDYSILVDAYREIEKMLNTNDGGGNEGNKAIFDHDKIVDVRGPGSSSSSSSSSLLADVPPGPPRTTGPSLTNVAMQSVPHSTKDLKGSKETDQNKS